MRFIPLAFAFAAGFAGPAWTEDAAPCGERDQPAGIVDRVGDGGSLLLRDGREILLAGLDLPRGIAAGPAGRMVGQSIRLRSASDRPDRYGRHPAYAAVAGANLLIQQDLLGSGDARMAARVGTAACAAALREAERPARDSGLGLWADPVYSVRRAAEGRALLADVGRFAVVHGDVVSVRESGGTLYVNFGRRWSEALTVTILKRNARLFAEAGVTRAALENSRLTVRGVIEERNGPRIEASRPEQIEIARN